MNLHRTTGAPDWAAVKPRNRNVWQHIAASTYGIATLSNIVTFGGFALVVIGLFYLLNHEYLLGAVLLAVGRAADILDGWLAEVTGTKSPLGELLDASLDKVGTFLTLGVMFVAGIAPWWIIVLLLLPHIVITFVTMIAVQHKQQLHPSRAGKLSMATVWVSLVGFVLMKILDVADVSVLGVFTYAVAFISVFLGCFAARGYFRDAIRKHFK